MGIIKKGKRKVYINKKIQQQKNQRQEQTVIVHVSNANKRRASAPRPKQQYNNQPPIQYFTPPTLQQPQHTQINEEFINRIISRIPTHHIPPEPKLSHSPASVASYSNQFDNVIGSPASVSFYRPKEPAPVPEYKEPMETPMETPREDLNEKMRRIERLKRKMETVVPSYNSPIRNDSNDDIGTIMRETENIEETTKRQSRQMKLIEQREKRRQQREIEAVEAMKRNEARVALGGKRVGRPRKIREETPRN